MKAFIDVVNVNGDASCLSTKRWLEILKSGEKSTLVAWLKLYTKYNYRTMGWTKKSLSNELQNLEHNNIVLRFIVDYFCINIFVINNDKVEIIYSGDKFNKYKNSIFLYYDNSSYYPIVNNNNQKIFGICK